MSRKPRNRMKSRTTHMIMCYGYTRMLNKEWLQEDDPRFEKAMDELAKYVEDNIYSFSKPKIGGY